MTTEKQIYDVIILGGGPAGLQAAIHSARRKVRTLVLGYSDKSPAGNSHISNLCCLDAIAPGDDFLHLGRRQAVKSGAELVAEDAVAIDNATDGAFVVTTESRSRLTTKSLILAMGAKRGKSNIKGENQLLGKGVSHCVDCDGHFFKNQAVLVLGNDSAAAIAALTLLNIAAEVHLVYQDLHVGHELKKEISESAIIEHPGTWLKQISGDTEVQEALLDNGDAIKTKGVFIELGARGVTELALMLGIELDPQEARYIQTDKRQRTNIPGIYAAGDICGPPWQVAKAIGEGCVAGLEAAAYVRQNI